MVPEDWKWPNGSPTFKKGKRKDVGESQASQPHVRTWESGGEPPRNHFHSMKFSNPKLKVPEKHNALIHVDRHPAGKQLFRKGSWSPGGQQVEHEQFTFTAKTAYDILGCIRKSVVRRSKVMTFPLCSAPVKLTYSSVSSPGTRYLSLRERYGLPGASSS